MVEGLRPGTLVVDMGTTEVPATRRFAQRIAAGDYQLPLPQHGPSEIVTLSHNFMQMSQGRPLGDEQSREREFILCLGHQGKVIKDFFINYEVSIFQY